MHETRMMPLQIEGSLQTMKVAENYKRHYHCVDRMHSTYKRPRYAFGLFEKEWKDGKNVPRALARETPTSGG